MAQKKANTIFFIFVLISIIFVLVDAGIIKVSYNLLMFSGVAYVLMSVILAFMIKKQVAKAATKVSKEVKIVYKERQPVKSSKQADKKDDKIVQLTKGFAIDLDQFGDKEKFAEEVLQRFAKRFDIVQGVFFLWDKNKEVYYTAGTYAFYTDETYKEFAFGEGITGQVAKNKKFLLIDAIPENYIVIVSGLGTGTPDYLAFVPVIHNGFTIGVIELATFTELPQPAEDIFMTISKQIAPFASKFV